ncbi:MAG: hypothetical protein RSA91_01800 [Bacilli bacterium]
MKPTRDELILASKEFVNKVDIALFKKNNEFDLLKNFRNYSVTCKTINNQPVKMTVVLELNINDIELLEKTKCFKNNER